MHHQLCPLTRAYRVRRRHWHLHLPLLLPQMVIFPPLLHPYPAEVTAPQYLRAQRSHLLHARPAVSTASSAVSAHTGLSSASRGHLHLPLTPSLAWRHYILFILYSQPCSRLIPLRSQPLNISVLSICSPHISRTLVAYRPSSHWFPLSSW
jgi:hypothetical protein